jgi:hypothetical protein
MAKVTTKAPAVQAEKFLRKTITGDVITFTLQNGLKVVFDLTKLHKDCEQTAKMHGISQVIGDTAAKFSKEKDFHGAFSAMQQKADNLEAGLWSVRGSGSADLAQALSNLGLGTLAEVEANLRLASDEERDEFLDQAAVKAEIAKIKAERAKVKADASEPADLKKLWKAFSGKGEAI